MAVRQIDPNSAFAGKLLITVPHMDDAILACGGALAKLESVSDVHVVYATDGMASPAPLLPWESVGGADLNAIRKAEARKALGSLGLAAEQITFFDFPDGKLNRQKDKLRGKLASLIDTLQPDVALTPFRYDKHADHLILNQVTMAICRHHPHIQLFEYFVYHHFRLLPKKDIRAYIRPTQLVKIDIEAETAPHKRAALEHFASQTTRFFPWQTRPNLMPQLLAEVSRSPEYFVRFDPNFANAAIFQSANRWIPIANYLEPRIKKRKDQSMALLRKLTLSARKEAFL